MAQQSESRYILEPEADLTVLAGKRVAIVGYGNLGRPFALNLRDSGVGPIVVGELPGPAWQQADSEGFPAFRATAAVSAADIVFLLVPDEQAPAIYKNEIAGALLPGATLVFASGFNLAFNRICPSPGLNVLMLAPRMIGAAIRDMYSKGQGFSSFVSLEQDATGDGWQVLCALIQAVGSLQAGTLTVSAKHEAYLDLFVEQTVGPDLASALLNAFQVGVEAGLPAEALVMELYMSGEMGRSFQAMAELGFFQQVKLHGYAAAYGGMLRFMDLDREAQSKYYRQVLEDISQGRFADSIQSEVEAQYPTRALLEEMLNGNNPITKAEDRVRKSMRLGKGELPRG